MRPARDIACGLDRLRTREALRQTLRPVAAAAGGAGRRTAPRCADAARTIMATRPSGLDRRFSASPLRHHPAYWFGPQFHVRIGAVGSPSLRRRPLDPLYDDALLSTGRPRPRRPLRHDLDPLRRALDYEITAPSNAAPATTIPTTMIMMGERMDRDHEGRATTTTFTAVTRRPRGLPGRPAAATPRRPRLDDRVLSARCYGVRPRRRPRSAAACGRGYGYVTAVGGADLVTETIVTTAPVVETRTYYETVTEHVRVAPRKVYRAPLRPAKRAAPRPRPGERG